MKSVGKEELGSGVNLEDLLNLHNLTDHPEFQCLSEGILAGPPPEANGGLYCEHSWDSLLCWPATPAGQLASQPCFDELNGISYDTSRKWHPCFLFVSIRILNRNYARVLLSNLLTNFTDFFIV